MTRSGDFLTVAGLVDGEPLGGEKIGARVGRYKILRLLGEGGCGVVYLAAEGEFGIAQRVLAYVKETAGSAEMPLMGKLPFFAAQRSNDCAWPGRRELPEGLNLPENSRIKSFRFKFDRDYRDENRGAGPATITFVYASGVGQGLQILVL